MNKLRLLFFFGLLVVLILIARHNSPHQPPRVTNTSPAPPISAPAAPSPTNAPPQVAAQSPAAVPTATPQPVDFKSVAERVAPAVAEISTFDASGKLLRTGTGCFISADGELVTTAEMVQGAAHAVAKVSDGRILNVLGISGNAAPVDLAVVKAETKKGVPFIAPNKSAQTARGAAVAVVGSPLAHRQPVYLERSISARGADAAGDWLGLSAAVPADCVGAPLVNERGELIGIVTSQHAEGALANIVRDTSALNSLLAHVDSHTQPAWQVADTLTDVPSPAEGPTKPPTRTAKIPLVRADQPNSSKLLYTPKPTYPVDSRHPNLAAQGEGRYRVRFAANGQVQDVEILESTHNPALDSAATQTLRRWKAAPGQAWSATVPVTFQP